MTLFLTNPILSIMTNFKKLSLTLVVATIVLTSATIAPTVKTVPADKIATLSTAINTAKLDGKITNTELRNIATIAKGEKLSLKEKIALKFFGKKIGKKILTSSNTLGSDGKSQLIAILLVCFVGSLGVHRFYLGYTWQGVVQLLTLGGCGIWSLIDCIRIITGSLQPKDNEYESTL